MRYFLDIVFNGKNYAGWQAQLNAVSVQDTLSNALTVALGQEITLTGAGRTDAGVHARQMVAHFDGPQDLDNDPSVFISRMHSGLPGDIRIRSVKAVAADAHARFDASARRYRYFIDRNRSPFMRELSYSYQGKLDIDAMREATAVLPAFTDFRCFARSGSDVSNFNCTIMQAEWQDSSHLLVFDITANRFLRNMVRAIVGTMLDIGRGRMRATDLPELIASGNRSLAGASAPAQGLFLWEVRYPPEIYIS